MVSIDKLLAAAAHMSVELGEAKADEILKACTTLEAAGKQLHGAIITVWQAELKAGRALSPATSKLIQKALGK